MSWEINALLALPFTLANTNLTVKTVSGTHVVAFTGSGRTYRHCLAPTSGSTRDLLREIAAVLTAATSATWTFTLHASGRVRITCSSVFDLVSVPGNAVWEALGFTTSRTNVTSADGDLPPKHLGIAVGAYGGKLQATRPGGSARTAGGRVFAFGAGRWTYGRTWTLDMVPHTPEDATATESPGTPWRPTLSALSALGTVTGRGPAWLDLHHLAANAQVAWCDDWRAAEADTSVPYLLGYLGPEGLLAPMEDPIDETWPVYRRAKLELVTDGTTADRA